MKQIVLIIIIMTVSIYSCGKRSKRESISNDFSNKVAPIGKSRLEQINDKTYRDPSVVDDWKNTIIKTTERANNILDTSNAVTLFYLYGDNLVFIEKRWKSAKEAIDSSYEIWRHKDLIMTIVGHPSISEDVITGEKKSLYVFEVEHKYLTGTFCLFFSHANPKKFESFNYFDRN